MSRTQATPPLRPGQRLAHEVCRDLALRPPLALPSQALIEALARQRSWMVLVRSATPAGSLRMSRAGFTGAIMPLQPDVWQIVVHGEARPTYREYLILTLLAPLLRGQVSPEGWWVRGELTPHPDEWIGEDFARTLLTDLTWPHATTADGAADGAADDADAVPLHILLVLVPLLMATALILALVFFVR